MGSATAQPPVGTSVGELNAVAPEAIAWRAH
eukprot:CAMPEP_0181183894 /NCGR_PEP_ID=MMETSP1096-20121128/8674_1 /TAXON_ID=156174 ORGANISM="Chrysochromulina ericina, Strain CCMP281" /NCGR_SAMPLE_ID=MMETSP1096 /ASSEMBLY_ACC=CAM_ASM_000453 /LENGTH=30 /DNA_ID= /DNA_START= /DNA_END= /DNA_ORIENTATION=